MFISILKKINDKIEKVIVLKYIVLDDIEGTKTDLNVCGYTTHILFNKEIKHFPLKINCYLKCDIFLAHEIKHMIHSKTSIVSRPIGFGTATLNSFTAFYHFSKTN